MPATDGREPVGFQKQKRRTRGHERGRYSQGNRSATEGIRDPNKAQGLELDSIRTHRWNIVSCSAVTGEGLKEGMHWVVQDAKDRLFLF